MKYKCDLCGHEFMQKNDFRRHQEKKNGCVPNKEIIEMKKQLGNDNEKEQNLQSFFKSCLDILRNDRAHLIGDEALHELSYFLILRLVERQIVDGTIDIYNLDYYCDVDKDDSKDVEEFTKKLENIKFSNFVEYIKNVKDDADILHFYNKFIWGAVLSQHPKFKDIFELGQKSAIKQPDTLKKLVFKLNDIDLASCSHDVLGEAYEKVFVDTVFGAGGNKKAELGQFFTPSKVKKLLIGLVNPTIKDGQIETFMDPACGTGGILINIIKHYKKLAKNQDISLKKISKQFKDKLYGIEIKNKIYNLCMSNMLINTGEILPHVVCDDSIRKEHNIRVDCICANPPFSVGIEYDELIRGIGEEKLKDYLPIKVGKSGSEVLFLQMMIHCLNVGGRCATVMLDGEKISGAKAGYNKAREYLMKSCNLKEVIMCPSGTFTSTASRTCILYFVKKYERKDVVEINKHIYKFVKKHATKKVKFYDFNPDSEEKIFLKEVDIDDIAKNNYSLSYADYVKEEVCDKVGDIEYISLGDLCEIKYGDRIVKSTCNPGKYDVYGSGNKTFTTDKFNREGYTIVIGRFALSHKCVHTMNKKFYLNDSGLSVVPKMENLHIEYLGYYMMFCQNVIYEMSDGCAQHNLGIGKFKSLEIPVPSIESQEEIIKFLDGLFKDISIQDVIDYYDGNDIFKYVLTNKFDTFKNLVQWAHQEKLLKEQIEFYKNKQKMYIELNCGLVDNWKKLGDVCKFQTGIFNSGDKKEKGLYPFYNSNANSPQGYYDEYCFDGKKYIIMIKDGGSGKNTYGEHIGLGKVFLVSGKVAATCHQLALFNKNLNVIIVQYIYYYLKAIKNNIMNMAHYTIGLGCIGQQDIKNIQIPIPSIEKQREIIKFCEQNEEKIKEIEDEIKKNKLVIEIILGKKKKTIEELNNEMNKRYNNTSKYFGKVIKV